MQTAADQTTAAASDEIDALARHLLASQLQALGLAGAEDLQCLAMQHGHVTPDYLHLWLAESLNYVAGIETDAADSLWQQWHERLPLWRQDPDLAARAQLLDACLKGLPALLRGEQTATRVLFPDGSMTLVEGVYKNNRICDYFNQVLIEAALAYIESRPAGAEPLRILEVGAGTGGTTAGLLAALAPWRSQIGEYCYTDLSRAFLQHGVDQFGRDNPFLQTRLFDVSRPCAEQGIDADHYHLVVATNVLHATPEIRQTLRNAKAVLRKGGLLMLNEISEASLFTHLSFGLLEGWWLHRDGALRIPGCPGLSPAGWQAVLEQEGFSPVLFPARQAHDRGQQIILAESDGIVRQPVARNERPAASPVDSRVPQDRFTPKQEETAPDGWRHRVADYLRNLVSTTLKIPVEKMSLSRPLEDYGLDSILVVRLTHAFSEHFAAIDSALFFEVPTLAALTEHFIQHRGEELEALLGKPEADVRETTADTTRLEKAAVPVEKAEASHIAIIGLDGRYPGAQSMGHLWRNLADGHCAIDEIPAERWDWRRYFAAEKGKSGHLYTRWGGFIEGIDQFDPAFFRISRTEAERMDPQERLFLQVAYHSIEDAGYNPATLHQQGEVGVFVGVMNGSYNPISNYWSIANRVSYQLDLQGPSFVVDSACSSSLTAIHLAVESLGSGSCDVAIAGGINLIINPQHYLSLCEMMMLSPGEHCRAFGDDADGFVDAEGVGAVVLKPLHKALADGDRIYGVIRGGAINAGGKTNGYTVPSAGAQQRVLEKALARSAVDASRISYIEAHGTGTALGDPIEISGLSRVFAHSDDARCAIGSIKSNIGHCESAAGIAGLSKVLLQLQHRQLVPSLHAAQPNPSIDFEQTSFRLQQQLAPWTANGATRIAAISSFGAGGANASLIVEEHLGVTDTRPAMPGPWLILLSARDPQRLMESASRLQAFLNKELDTEQPEMADLAWTLQTGREAMAERLALRVDSIADVQRCLASWLAGEALDNVFHGHSDPYDPTMDEPTSRPIDHWLQHQQLTELATAWVQGEAIDWQQFYLDKAYRRPERISLPGYPFARNSYWMPGLAHPPADAALVETPIEQDLTDCCYLPRWQAQTADEQATVPGVGAVVLVTLGESTSATGLLWAALAEHNQGSRNVLRIDGGIGATTELATGHWHCGDDDPTGFAHILSALGPVAQILVIGAQTANHMTPLALADSLQHHELPLLRLFKALQTAADDASSTDCFLLSFGRYSFAGAPQRGNPLGAGMAGLGYAMAQSEHRVHLRTLDLNLDELETPHSRQRLLAQILAEPASPRGELIKLSRGERFIQQLIPLALPPTHTSTSALQQNGVYLILGGSGVIGQVISRQLIEDYQARVIWLGRKPADSEQVQHSLKAEQFRGRVDYLQVDATDLVQLQQAVALVNQRYGRINGAVFSAMVFDFENSIQHTTEAQFQQILDIKSRGSLHFYQALVGQPLDFLCYFSSGQGFAFSGAAKLSAYACGITFADAFAEAIGPTAGFPVGVINWGFWRASLQAQKVSQHLDALDDDEGFACFSRFVAQLSSGSLRRLLCLKASPAVRQLMAVPEGQQLRLDPMVLVPETAPGVELEPAERERLQQIFDPQTLDQSIAVLLLIQLQTLGIFTGPGAHSAEVWRQQARISERYRRWWQECLAILVEHGYLQQHGEVFAVATPVARTPHAAILAAWKTQRDHYFQDRERRVQVTLIDDCLQQLPQILTGRIQATDLLFPDGSMDKVEGIYQHNTLSDFFNEQLASQVIAHVRRQVLAEPGRPVRILEIGAGTGGTTAALLAALEPLAGQIGEYCYSDLSRAFLQHGEARFAAGRPYFTTQILDISQPAESLQPYDIVVATNVLHATANMRRTLVHVRSLLRSGGLLALNELNRKTTAATATFGLLDGWWLYEDPALRIPGSPLIAEQTWLELLWSSGFEQVDLHIPAQIALGQQIITAHGDALTLQVFEPQRPATSAQNKEFTLNQHPASGPGASVDVADRLQQVIIEALGKTLKADGQSIALRTPFSDYGVDSILGVGFVKQLGNQLGIKLNSAILFEQATVSKLHSYLQKSYGPQIERALAEPLAATAAHGPQTAAALIKPVMAAALAGEEESPSTRPQTRNTGRIAVIGMAGQFPGADNVDELWDNLLAGRNGVQALGPDYLQSRAYSADKQPGKSYCNRAGILKDRDCFDPLFFNLTPHEAESMTPHQRLVLQESWKALEDAGCNPMTLAGEAVSIYVGAEPGGYHHDSFTGSSEAIVASRLSYFLDLKGPAMVVNTGCSSSAVAIHQACESLRHGESRLALAGGVYALLDQRGLISLSAIDMLSPSGQCHAFDAAADGTVISEGVGMVVLKRLEDAEAAGDPIYAVIEASGVNQDGASNGITAPNGDAQEQLLRDTWHKFGVDPAQISYVEAHGTGTRLGDPVEANALIRAFRAFTDAQGYCVLGSAKANLGHAAAGAGVIGLIKVLLSIRQCTLPVMPGFAQVNPLIELEHSPFYINRQAQAWQASGGERLIAALNSFGHSGTNAHLVIGEYQTTHSTDQDATPPAVSRVIPLSGKTAASLRDNARALAHWLDKTDPPLSHIAFTLQTAREPMRERAALVVSDLAQLRIQLALLANGDALPVAADDNGRLASEWVAGSDIDWAALWPTGSAKRIHLPPYQFAKERYWVDQTPQPIVEQDTPEDAVDEPANGLFLARPVWQEPLGASADAHDDIGQRLLLWVGFSSAQVAQLQSLSNAAGAGVRGEILPCTRTAPAARYQELAIALLLRLQTLKGRVHVELMIAEQAPEHLLYAGLDGLLKTACLEQPALSARCLMIEVEPDQPLSATQLAQLTTTLGENRRRASSVLQRSGQQGECQELQWQELADDVAARREHDRIIWKDHGVYLITGGAGGLGLIFADAIAEQCSDATLILIGRSALDARQQARLQAIRDAGAVVIYQQVDLTDAEALAQLIDDICTNHGGLNGVLHGAGINRDRLLAHKTAQDMVEVFAAKVIGTELLDRACRRLYLDFFVLFSSCSAVLGSIGQSDYAAANGFVDHFAGLRNKRVEQGLRFGHTLSINYPLWRDGGMQVSAADRAHIRHKTGMAPMQSVHGIQALQLGLNAGLERLLVIEGDLAQIRAHFGATEETDTEPALMSAPVAVERTRLTAAILERLKAVFCAVTKLPPDRVESAAPLEQYGIDSIMITRLNKALEDVFSAMTQLRPAERLLSKTLFFEYHSLDALTGYLVAEHHRACLLWSGLADVPVPIAPIVTQTTQAPAAMSAAEPIAIIGISGRYPQAANLDEYWRNLKEGRDSITEIPPQRWSLEGFYVDSVSEALKQARSYSKWGGFIDGFADFDPLFFNISPREAVNMDPQERLFLQSCWQSLEDAGITKADLAEQYQGNVGVFAGITKTGYSLYGPALREQGHMVFPRTSFGSTANRVSYVLDLNGPSEPVDTMCSSSLSALHRACESLRRGECRMAFAGGVNLYLHPSNYVELSAGQMLSKDGRCRSFGEGGNGFVPGEGVGSVLLKPLSRALADRDNIHALIRAVAVNHGGKTNGYTVPNPQAQAKVIRLAIDQAGLDASKISYIEAHGTGTELGDPIEVSGLSQAFALDGVELGHCALGSVKANIGHLEGAAGIAGVSKVILQLKHKQLVPSLHATTLNPNLTLDATPFYLQQTLRDWCPAGDGPRIAGVSSFGAGGANAHVLLQEHDEYRELPTASGAEVILLSARDGERLRDYAQALLAYVVARPSLSGADLANLAYTLQTGREMMAARLGLVVDSPAALATQLRRFIERGAEPDAGLYVGDIQRKQLCAQADAELAPVIRRWAESGKLHKLLELWVNGEVVDWTLPHALRAGPLPYRISVPVYPFARETFWLPGIEPVATPETVSAEAAASTSSDHLSYLARWQADGQGGEPMTAEHRCVLIVGDASIRPVAEAITAHYLLSAGFTTGAGRVIRLEPGTQTVCLVPDHWSLDVADPQALEHCLSACPAIDCLYFFGGNAQATDWQAQLDSPKTNEILLLRLIKWLKQHSPCQAIDSYIISQDNFDISGEPVSAVGGGLTGMAYAIAQGEHRFRVRNLDVDSRELADHRRRPGLLRQVQGEDGLARGEVLCLRDGVRYRQRIFNLSWQPQVPLADGRFVTPALKRGGVYVILGGSGTVGSIISRYLLADYQARVIWLGRSGAADPKVQQRLANCLQRVDRTVDPAQLHYLQADANDAASLQRAMAQIKQRHGAINGAIFSAVVFNHEDPITRIAEPQFDEILQVKSRGGIEFYRALADEPLDFMCYFSSGQSFAFSGAARLGAYAAGITFGDTLVRSLRRHAAFPVGAINWGFWLSSLTEQQAADPLAQPMSRHAGALEDREGFGCFARFVEALSHGQLDQVLCMAASAPVQQLMQLQPQPIILGQTGIQSPDDGFERYRIAAAPLLAAHDPLPFDQAMAGMTLVQLRRMGLFTQPGQFQDSEVLRRQAGIGEHYGRWWATSLELLQQQGLVQRRGTQVAVTEQVDSQPLEQRWCLLREELIAVPQRKAQVQLVDACLQQLPAILGGRTQATDVMFPNGSMDKVEGVYRHNALSDYFNQVVAGVVQQHIEALLIREPQRQIRILEIGAGTGGTSSIVLPALQAWRGQIAEYCYTDISKAFLMYARKTYGEANPFLTYQVWNVEQPPQAQGLELGSYDIVIAANVLHATGSIRRTLTHAGALLRRDAMVVMNEISDRSLFAHLTFGLLKGWWLYEDPELRIPGTPALYPQSWASVLGETGFHSVTFPAQCVHGLGQQIIVAHSDGMERVAVLDQIEKPLGSPAPTLQTVPAATGSGREVLTALVLDGLAKTLQLEPGRIQADQPFADYGIDSILGVSFVSHIGEALGTELNTALLFDYSSLQSLVDYLLGQYPAQCARLGGGAAQPVVPEPPASDQRLEAAFLCGELAIDELLKIINDSTTANHGTAQATAGKGQS
ncbi:SDR family NAD(P)-dependent oxidoreductase [Pseudomonas sp. BCA14]|uniref:SDR family NAD(P)-dependent oxidoreductase n=1 Tax=unclassified Pseudomonas TaxID=196821 RepID=UPI00106EDC23|nr:MULTISPECIES: SDR family NAD(P)-dependent oxidoreductase [unclassified Pseudomonas]TFF02915.1 SDR family NAD(P)-dependent oxidoreductase [Pseudomonas sp. JMN1]TFF04316.1 SDR family NAD(P)-dependent oxidoreductase [Pseudomonas sp. BCA17]TFF20108.1 SDR family NAD(P)-dependent oxidoreductase [Pseudomonas sp. BCA14]TFF20367.1 SDR family NAD(P)-dependent oxidoreductase [Pseudomonas sp. BCA13]